MLRLRRLCLAALIGMICGTGPAVATQSEADIQQLFARGLTQQAAGDHLSARASYERVLAVRPEANRVRLELARSYFETGDFARARREFNTVLATAPPPQVAATIGGFLREMDRGRKREVRLGLAIRKSSEATRRYQTNTVMLDLFGSGTPLPFTLNRAAPDRTGVELNFGVSLERRTPAGQTAFFEINGSYFSLGENDYDESVIVTRWGRGWSAGRGVASLAALAEFEVSPGSPSDTRIGPQVFRSLPLKGGSRLSFTAAALLGFSGSDQSEIGRLKIGWDLANSAQSQLSLALERRASAKASLDYSRATVSFQTTVLRTDKLIVRARSGLDVKVGNSIVPGFSQRRRDQKLDLSLEFVGQQDWRIFGFSPVVTLTKSRNRSNIAAYSFDSDLVATVRFGKSF